MYQDLFRTEFKGVKTFLIKKKAMEKIKKELLGQKTLIWGKVR
jgi:hypothetical protein